MKVTYALAASLASLASAQVYSGPLYVYGDSTTTEVNDLQVFSNGETIYLGDYRALNDPEYAPVTYSLDLSNNVGTAKIYLNPNTTGLSQKPTWSNRILAEPNYTGASGLRVVALDPNAGNLAEYRTKWLAYHSAIFSAADNGDASFSGREYAERSAVPGVWDVYAYWIGSADNHHFNFRTNQIA
ncbi:unnamed protein product [Clonostachys rhizophaga]|uniref:Uncharacterized protein n=1 Tax=Clonostachys rhizophaga TaxID=160324 RepID=A0A9N9YSE6_9HYPO|nr:unnamed protein product [Clonostachys rhizophaga]